MPLSEQFSTAQLKRYAEIQIAIMAAARQNGGAVNFTLHLAEYPSEEFGHDELENSNVGIRVGNSLTRTHVVEQDEDDVGLCSISSD